MNSISKLFRDSAKVCMPLTMALAGALHVIPAQALTFNFNAAPDIDANALAGFQTAGNFWSSIFTDDVTINIDINFSSLDPGVLAQAGSNTEGFSYSEIENALKADRKSADDFTAVANLPGIDIGAFSKAFAFVGTEEDGSLTLDPETEWTADNVFLDVNRANAKALGLLTNDGSADASITFNSDFNFDFDRSNGIDNNSFDFIGIAAHEIGHALGFVSGVDTVDYLSGSQTPYGQVDLDPYRIFSVLDLYRYSDLSVQVGNSYGLNILDLSADTRDKYFSIDGGVTNLASFSTGSINGDGNQASHWKDDLGLGIMDPTAGNGELLNISALDTQAFDVIGWDTQSQAVPEPTTIIGSLVLGAGFLAKRRQRRSYTNSP
ncbi:NF038122 family metalloprotease [Merismopedia glauca]|nr:NF038122 family metalloprotease [Merismopedia glauca]